MKMQTKQRLIFSCFVCKRKWGRNVKSSMCPTRKFFSPKWKKSWCCESECPLFLSPTHIFSHLSFFIFSFFIFSFLKPNKESGQSTLWFWYTFFLPLVLYIRHLLEGFHVIFIRYFIVFIMYLLFLFFITPINCIDYFYSLL
jgi:hypothetical protein